MYIVNLKEMSDAFNSMITGRSFPVIHMHPDTIKKYAAIYSEDEDHAPSFKGVVIEYNPNVEKDRAYFFNRTGVAKTVALTFAE